MHLGNFSNEDERLLDSDMPHRLFDRTVHGIAQSITSAARTLGPIVGGWGLGLGLKYNIVGAVWWGLAGEALLGWGATMDSL
ncbi:uncharacterized protein N7477_003346 [Penicillium maclennaniae]|uniref:uncharacterized protein n=1 Tax=Penicillium maclennaniae TaxID=1343394 RepID=UPI0025402280|nr:uncharacterized protein N7477_003346 [Penicillium maclennaniae]KAJ5677713.1 hypothetical protein N7477_003346 [Penicillium maclennaniae]